MISENQIKKYQTLCKTHFNKEVSREEAYEQANRLINLMRLTYKPILKQEYDDLEKRREKDSEADNDLIKKSNEDMPP